MTAVENSSDTGLGVFLTDDGGGTRYGVGAVAVFVALSVVYIGFRLWDITGPSLWFDEIFALGIARVPWNELLATLATDKTTPPLFYILLKLWITIGGESLLWLKLLPFAFSVINLVPLFFLCKELRMSGFAMNLTLALMAPNGFLINYAQEVRMYSLLMLFTTFSIWLFVRYINRPDGGWTGIAALFVANVFLVFSHYFGWLVVGVEAVFLLCLSPRRVIPLIAPAVVLALSYVPWVYMVSKVAASEAVPFWNIMWIERPNLRSVVKIFLVLSGPVNLIPIAIWMVDKVRRRALGPDGRVLVLLSALIDGPALLVFIASWIGPRSIWHVRYFIIAAVPLMALVAASIDRLRPRALRVIFTVCAIGFMGYMAVNPFRTGAVTRVKWQAMAAEIVASEPAGTEPVKVYAFEVPSHEAVRFYLEEARAERFKVTMIDDPSQIADDRFWLVIDTARESRRAVPPIDALTRQGYWVDKTSPYGYIPGEILLVRFTR